MLPIPVSSQEFKDKVNIRFNNILDGFDRFDKFTIDGNLCTSKSEEQIIDFILYIFQENNNGCYIDFYLNRLNGTEINNLMNLIDSEYIPLFKSLIEMNHNDVYYKITDKALLPFFIKLNTRELFFVTFYFIDKPVTIWGNYNLKFPCFFNDSDILKKFLDKAEKNELI